nr:PREDICTED: CMT1A duplicated region transcript 4 protein [Odobenus rosmarus divergens]
MNCARHLQELPDGRREDKKRSEKGLWAFNVKNSLVMEMINARKIKTEEELTENIGLPVNVLEKHSPWPAYVTYVSPMVKRLVEKSKARDLECMQALEESQRTSRQSKPASITQLKRRKSPKCSGTLVLKDLGSETMLSMWSSYSMPAMGPTTISEPRHFHTDARENPTANYNKIIFSRKLMMKMLPYSSLLASKEKHSNI